MSKNWLDNLWVGRLRRLRAARPDLFNRLPAAREFLVEANYDWDRLLEMLDSLIAARV